MESSINEKNKKNDIVIARYKENISWIDEYYEKYKLNVIIYNKGNLIYKPEIYKNIELINYGRESHTYLKYIIDNYDNLPPLVVFTQGCNKDHITNVDDLINNDLLITASDIPYLSDCKNFRLHQYYGNLELNKDGLTCSEWIKKYIEPDIENYIKNNYFKAKYGACFSIKKEYILSRTKLFYEELFYQLQSLNPEVGHFFERSWYYIFNCHKKINIIQELVKYINLAKSIEKLIKNL